MVPAPGFAFRLQAVESIQVLGWDYGAVPPKVPPGPSDWTRFIPILVAPGEPARAGLAPPDCLAAPAWQATAPTCGARGAGCRQRRVVQAERGLSRATYVEPPLIRRGLKAGPPRSRNAARALR